MLTADASLNNSALPEIYPDTNRLRWGRPGVASSNWPPAKAKRTAWQCSDSILEKKQNICYMVESMFFDLTLANVAIVDWICWKAGSLEKNQLLWHRLFPISPARFEGARHCGGWMKWFHLNGSTISMTASILPVSVPSAGQKLQIPCVSKMARTSNGGKNHRFIVFQIMLSQAFPRAPTRLLPTWRVTAETCWAIEPTIPQYEWKTEMWVEPLTHQQYWRFFALPIRKHTKKNTQPTIKKWFNRIKKLDKRW